MMYQVFFALLGEHCDFTKNDTQENDTPGAWLQNY